MAELLLRPRLMEAGRIQYSGPSADLLWLPLEDHGTAYVQLMLVDLDVETLAAVAEIANVLGAQFVPRDGGPPVAADAEAICRDIARRALHRIRTPRLSLYATALAREAELELVD
ncbi:hypothetical protein [Xylophilus sp. GOD-11R]|uniref:hypothetical protein n=1 Tax=Xylophilus sp. GOD-11R TaxID=3089814 RepID=UPI00298CD77A|nr:hypothetical protein [Xylophilus sp. GOD-11R]WPB57375.1 hypothetical protein R9X41_01600 [Xylophilus sp. GOD-11R]